MLVGQKDCIFCGAPADSAEHVWPDWLKQYIPRTHSHRTHSILDGNRVQSHILRPGDPRSGKLNVTCKRCNNGWISVVDDNAKPILLALADGRWGEFTAWQRTVLAAWATRFSMVYEFAHPASAAANFKERERLRLWREPPPDWYTMIGFYAGQKWRSMWNHRSAYFLEGSSTIRDMDHPNAQSTVATLGYLLLNVVRVPAKYDITAYAENFGLRVIWPRNASSIGAPAHVFDDEEVDYLAFFMGANKPFPAPPAFRS